MVYMYVASDRRHSCLMTPVDRDRRVWHSDVVALEHTVISSCGFGLKNMYSVISCLGSYMFHLSLGIGHVSDPKHCFT